jgi:hypothetical protein
LSLKSTFASAAGSAGGLGATTTGVGAAAAVGALRCGSFLEQPTVAEANANAISPPLAALSKRFIVLVSFDPIPVPNVNVSRLRTRWLSSS